jgi:hypothetical protein
MLLVEGLFTFSSKLFLVIVQVSSEALKYDDDMLSESEVIKHFDKIFIALVILKIALLKFFQDVNLNICIVNIKFFVFAELSCNYFSVWVLVVNALYNLTKCPFVNYFYHFIAVS